MSDYTTYPPPLRQFSNFDPQPLTINRNTNLRILVIGGAGYVGSVLCRELLKLNYNIRILDLLLYGNESLKYLSTLPQVVEVPQALQCYISDFRNVNKIIEAMVGIDIVIHLGAIVGDAACQISPNNTIQTNYIATRAIAQIAKAFGVKRMVFASTCSVYGASYSLVLTEDEPRALNPVSLYARTKINAEQAILATTSNTFSPVILRFATIYGISPRPRFDLVVNLLSAKAQTERKITITGGQQWRPFVHVTDVVNAIIKVIQASNELVCGEIFNVGASQENYQINQIGRIIKSLYPRTQIITEENILDKRNYYVKFDKIKNTLNFTNSRTISDGVQEVSRALQTGEIKNYHLPNYNNYLALKMLAASKVLETHPGTASGRKRSVNAK
jgi:nucleoside-diphosphate-sugar epimerase